MTSFLGDIWLWGANPGRLTREWWDGARAVRLTPLSAVILMLLLQGLVGHMEARYLAVVDPRLNVVIRPMTLMVIAAFATACLAVLPALTQPRTVREHLAFAIYEGCFLSLAVLWGWFSVLLLAVTPTTTLAAWRPLLAVSGILGTAALLVHPVWHLKAAYGLSWPGAAWRSALLGVFCVLGVVAGSLTLEEITGRLPPPDPGFLQMQPDPRLPVFEEVD